MKKALLALAIVAFVVAGAAQPAMAQQEEDIRQPDLDINQSEENETEEDEVNETDQPDSPGESAQFDARLGTAIRTVDALIEIAPNDEAETGLQNALDQLREVQNNTDTASLGSEDRPEETENDSEPGEELGQELGQEGEEGSSSGPPGTRGPSENSNRPDFVNQMLGGIFG